jgi:hypothetical protein
VDDYDGRRLIGRADVPGDCGPPYVARRIGPGFATAVRFTIGAVTHFPSGGAPVVKRAVMASPGQLAELLPGWVPLAS